MMEMIPFCEENDPDPPDFVDICVRENLIRDETDLNKKVIDKRIQEYYHVNWQKVILNIMRYKNPLIANAHLMTSLTNKIDTESKLYFHIDWLKPGRHTFLIQHDNYDIKFDYLEEKQKSLEDVGGVMGMFDVLKKKREEEEKGIAPKPQLKKSERGFYVHDMLATFRTDPIPIFFKERHVHKETYNKYVGKLIFKNLG